MYRKEKFGREMVAALQETHASRVPSLFFGLTKHIMCSPIKNNFTGHPKLEQKLEHTTQTFWQGTNQALAPVSNILSACCGTSLPSKTSRALYHEFRTTSKGIRKENPLPSNKMRRHCQRLSQAYRRLPYQQTHARTCLYNITINSKSQIGASQSRHIFQRDASQA